MQKKSFQIFLVIISVAAISFQGMIYLLGHYGLENATMALAYLSVIFLFWQLIRLIRAVNQFRKAVEGRLKEQTTPAAYRWNPESEAPRVWSAIPAFFFGERQYTWEELFIAYAFFAGLIWAFRFLLQTVG
jgi:hypothetical protein